MSASSRPPNINMDLAPNHPHQPEEPIPPFPTDVDVPALDPSLKLPPKEGEYSDLLLGCATFGYGVYESKEHVRTNEPLKIVKTALDAGINGFDTSPHYHPSETILGHALASLRAQYPRESYKLLTKAGKYGPRLQDHVYSPDVIRASVERSLRRLQTSYLDVVYLHDCEFLSSFPFPMPAGDHSLALSSEAEAEAWGLAEPYNPRGEGDAAVLAAFQELRKMQKEGKIRACGLAGYPLPTLLRFCRMIKAQTGESVNVVQNYSHFTLQNSALEAYLPAFTSAGVRQVINAAPLSMGLLTTAGPPGWHPAVFVDHLRDSAREAAQLCKKEGGSIEEEGLRFGYKRLSMGERGKEKVVPCVIGCTTREQLIQTLQTFKKVRDGEERSELGDKVRGLLEERGALGVSWQKPAPEEMI